jgi:large subunit ribosomal protein L34
MKAPDVSHGWDTRFRIPSTGQRSSFSKETFMHYPHRISRIKRKRSIGFRARMKSTNGRKMMNRKRRAGRSLNVADK